MKPNLSEALNKNIPQEIKDANKPPEKPHEVSDYEFSRDSYRELIEKANQGIERALELAQQSDHPRAFEVLANMIKSTSDIVDKLMELQHSKQDLSEKKAEANKGVQPQIQNGQQPALQQTNVFVGSPAELQKLLGKNKLDINV